MQQVIFIVYPGFELLDASGPASVFNGANRALGQQGKPPFYETTLVSAEGGMVESSSGITVQTQAISDLQARRGRTVLVAGAEREPLLIAVGDPVLRAALPALAAHPIVPETEAWERGDWFDWSDDFVSANAEAGRLDDVLLAAYGERYVQLRGNAHRTALLTERLSKMTAAST